MWAEARVGDAGVLSSCAFLTAAVDAQFLATGGIVP
ncbi:MAG: hypothetical protein K0Q89_242, partial [Thermomicrobiales bacterium]|nr:hypothetical protein [Thermomicrobiales bacterium]